MVTEIRFGLDAPSIELMAIGDMIDRVLAERGASVAPLSHPLASFPVEPMVAPLPSPPVETVAPLLPPPPVETAAPPPPPPPVETVTPPPPTPIAPTVAGDDERDADGFPWDERIHSSSRAILQDGRWRQRRNLPDGVREAVEAELRGALNAPGVPVPPVITVGTPIVTGVPGTPIPVPPPPGLPEDWAPSAEVTGALVPAEVPPPPSSAADEPLTFPTFMLRLTSAMTAGRANASHIAAACAALGIPNMAAAKSDPALVAQLAEQLGLS